MTAGLLPDTQNCRLRMRWECWGRFPRHWLQRKPLVSDHCMHHVRDARAVMHAGSAKPRRRGKHSRHSRRMRNPNFSYLVSDPCCNCKQHQKQIQAINIVCTIRFIYVLYVTFHSIILHSRRGLDWVQKQQEMQLTKLSLWLDGWLMMIDKHWGREKWSPICRWHFGIIFLKWMLLYLDTKFTDVFSLCSVAISHHCFGQPEGTAETTNHYPNHS